MPLTIEVPGYSLESVLSRDNFLHHYDAADGEGNPCVITEFNPAYMVNRGATGELEVVPRFSTEYEIALEKFITMATAMKEMNDPSVTSVEAVIENNKTAYIVRKVNDLPTLDTYMSGKRMEFGEAFLFIRPLFLYLAQAERNGLLFNLDNINLRVNRYGQLVLDSMFLWDSNFHATVTGITKLYFQLITGSAHVPEATAQALGVNPPQKLDTMLTTVFSGDILYGSIDDFFKQFKSLVDTDTGMGAESGGAGISTALLKWTAIGLAVLFITSLLVVLNLWLLPAYRNMFPGLANPILLDIAGNMEAHGDVPADFFAVAYTNPGDGSDVLNGAFYLHEGVLYKRDFNNGYSLTVRTPNGAQSILVNGVRPSFIQADGEYVYFCDGLDGNSIYRVRISDGQKALLSSNTALYLRLAGNYLYYTNHNDFNRLYRINLTTLVDELFLPAPVFETAEANGRLFFTDGSRGFNLFSAGAAQAQPLTRLNEENSGNVILHNGLVYYLAGDELRVMAPDGQPIAAECPIKIYQFYPAGDWLAIIEAGTHALHAYHPDTGEQRVITSIPCAYVWAHENMLYVIDYNNGRITRPFFITP
jgi:hypothetical protein